MPAMTEQRTCSVEGCGGKHRGRGYCNAHLVRLQRRGTTDLAHEPRPEACVVDGCGDVVHAKGLCNRHYIRRRVTGDPLTPRMDRRKEPTSYRQAHKAVEYANGPAASHACLDCGNPASDWSYVGPYDGPYSWSADTSLYVPRCKPCHATFDVAQRK
jgi:hypothetical protein